MKTLDRLEKRINAAGITTRRATIYRSTADPDPVPVLVAVHDYEGPYPTRDALEKLDTVRRICARYRVRSEVRGYSQAPYIREEVTPA